MKKERGITLIALVITIIVLLILAGVTLNMVIGQNGIFNKANNAKEQTKSKNADEIIKLAIIENKANYYGNQNNYKRNAEELKEEIITRLRNEKIEIDTDGDTIKDIKDADGNEIKISEMISKYAVFEGANYNIGFDLEEKNIDLYQNAINNEKILKVTNESEEGLTYTWQSLNENVAKVNDKGKVTAVGKGNCEIKCIASKYGISKEVICNVNVTRYYLYYNGTKYTEFVGARFNGNYELNGSNYMLAWHNNSSNGARAGIWTANKIAVNNYSSVTFTGELYNYGGGGGVFYGLANSHPAYTNPFNDASIYNIYNQYTSKTATNTVTLPFSNNSEYYIGFSEDGGYAKVNSIYLE